MSLKVFNVNTNRLEDITLESVSKLRTEEGNVQEAVHEYIGLDTAFNNMVNIKGDTLEGPLYLSENSCIKAQSIYDEDGNRYVSSTFIGTVQAENNRFQDSTCFAVSCFPKAIVRPGWIGTRAPKVIQLYPDEAPTTGSPCIITSGILYQLLNNGEVIDPNEHDDLTPITMNIPDKGILVRLDDIESRLSVIENQLGINQSTPNP